MKDLQFVVEAKVHGFSMAFLGLIVGLADFRAAVLKAKSDDDLNELMSAWGFPAEYRFTYFDGGKTFTDAQKIAKTSAEPDPNYPVSGCEQAHVKTFMGILAKS